MAGSALQYGVLLPHFGSQAHPQRLLDAARASERYGFDSVWVRDHIVYHPHEHEDQDRTHVDPFVALSAIAAVTERITLATGTLIPHRHPIHAALLLGSLDWIAGPGRIIAGWGIGTYGHEFEAIERTDDRRKSIEEYVAIMRALWRGEPVTFEGDFYRFTEVDVHPVPGPDRSIPIWYGGSSPAAARRAVEYCDGWIPGRMPRSEIRSRVDRMKRLAAEAGKPAPTAGAIPYVVPARTVEEGVAHLDMPNLIGESLKLYGPPATGAYETIDDLDGAAIAGPPDVLVEEIRRFQEAGVDHFVFDMRARFDAFEECLAMVGEEILPQLHQGDGRQVVAA